MAEEILGRIKSEVILDTRRFTQGVSQIDQKLRLLKSEFDASAAKARAFGKTQDQLRTQSQILARQIETQREKVALLNKAHQDAAKELGAESREAQSLAIRANRAAAALAKLEGTYKQLNAQMEDSTLTKPLDQLDQKLRLVQSEFRVAEAHAKAFGTAEDIARTQIAGLEKQIDLHRQKVNLLKQAYESSARSLGQNALETQEAAVRLNEARAALTGLEGQLKRVSGQLNNQASFLDRYRKNLFHIQEQAIDTGIALGVFSGAMAVAFGSAVKKAADFEAQLSSVQAVTGASAQDMEQFRNIALEMGAQTKFSALEAAQGIEELAKAGLSTAQILNGGLQGALNLAAAGEIDLAEAAKIASTVLNAFRKDNLSVAQAADILAGAANASATDIQEMNFGLSQVSAVAASAGLSFRDTAAALAVFAQNGLKGSDAGTSLKTMLLNLTPSTKEATAEMKRLGIITADGKNQFFDAQGRVKSFAEIAGILQKQLGGLSDEQRNLALKTMFGTDAIRAANIAFKEGAAGVNRMIREMSKTTALEVARTRMDNLKGTIEELKGAFETFQIQMGTAFLPVIRSAAEGLKGLVDWFSNLNPTTKEAIGIFTAVTAGVIGLGAAVAGIVAVANPFTAAILGAGVAIGGLSSLSYKLSQDMKLAEENAIRFGYGVSEGTIQAAKGYIDLRDQALVNLAKLRTVSGAEAKKIVDETVAIFAQMGDKIIANLNQDKINIQKAVASLLGKIPEVVRPGVEGIEKEALKRIDEQIKKVQEANEIIRKGLVDFGGDIAKMPKQFAQAYQQALKDMDQSSQTFVKRVSDLDSFMKNITADQGKITAQGAKNWVKEIQTAYDQAIKAAKDWAQKQKATWEEAFANGQITKQQYDLMIQAVETGEQQMIDVAKNKRAQAIKELEKSLSEEANLYDLKTGEMLDNYQGYVSAKAGLMMSEQDLIKRGKELNGEYFRSLIQDAAQSSQAVKQKQLELIKAYADLGLQMKAKLKVDLSPEGRQNIETLKLGMQSKLIDIQQAAALLGLNIKSNVKVDLGPAGQHTVQSLLQGLQSGKISIEQFAKGIELLLKTEAKVDLSPEGKAAGDSHARGLQQSKPNVQNAASSVKSAAEKTLGATTDGGGGSKASGQFASGIASGKKTAGSNAAAVAGAAKSNLVVTGTYGLGQNVAAGFASGILSGKWGVIDAAKAIARAAWNAIKKELGIASPSREMMKLGAFTALGFEEGMKDRLSQVQRVGEMLALAAMPSIGSSRMNGSTTGLTQITIHVNGNNAYWINELIRAIRGLNLSNSNPNIESELIRVLRQVEAFR